MIMDEGYYDYHKEFVRLKKIEEMSKLVYEAYDKYRYTRLGQALRDLGKLVNP
jgi:hypothetical protein